MQFVGGFCFDITFPIYNYSIGRLQNHSSSLPKLCVNSVNVKGFIQIHLATSH